MLVSSAIHRTKSRDSSLPDLRVVTATIMTFKHKLVSLSWDTGKCLISNQDWF
jgi:hypothetical protein